MLISVIGVGITFTALGVLIFVIWLLQKIFPYKPEIKPTPSTESNDEGRIEKEYRAAAAAAWWIIQDTSDSSLGENLTHGPGRWWQNIKSTHGSRHGK